MLFDLLKTKELSEIGRQIINSNIGLVESVLNTSQKVLHKGVEYNRSVLQSSINTVSTSREQAGRLVDQVFEQSEKVEKQMVDVLNDSSDKAAERINELFDRVGNPSEPVNTALDSTVLTSLNKISEPAVDLLKNTAEKLLKVPNKILKTAAKSTLEGEVKSANIKVAAKAPTAETNAKVKNPDVTKASIEAKKTVVAKKPLAVKKPVVTTAPTAVKKPEVTTAPTAVKKPEVTTDVTKVTAKVKPAVVKKDSVKKN